MRRGQGEADREEGTDTYQSDIEYNIIAALKFGRPLCTILVLLGLADEGGTVEQGIFPIPYWFLLNQVCPKG